MTMQRAIDGFQQDEASDWVAELRCGHGQHVRHRPPFWVRPWALTPEGRAEKRGIELPCVCCDRFELPDGYAPYKRTREFDELSIPDALRKDHSMKPGGWGVIHVLAGRAGARRSRRGTGCRRLRARTFQRGWVNTVNVKLTPTKVKIAEPLLSTTKGIEKLKKNQPVEHVLQWREAKELKK